MTQRQHLVVCPAGRSDPSFAATLAALLVAATGMVRAATFVVTSTADSNGPSCGPTCSLREALNAANNNPGADAIHFNIGGSGVRVITVATPYPALAGPTLIDGYTQPGSATNTLPVGSNATLLIRIDASALSGFPLPAAITLTGGASTVRGLSIRAPTGGVLVTDTPGNTGNVIEGVWIGLSSDGLTGVSNSMSIIAVGSANTSGLRIGGPLPQQRNVLLGGAILGSPTPAINIRSSNAVVVNNYFDTNMDGLIDLSNAGPSGRIFLRAGVRFGGPTTGERNLVIKGVTLDADSGTGVIVEGNYFGLGADGLTAMPAIGTAQIDIAGGSGHVIRNNIIGAGPAASGIRIGATAVPGVQVLGNWIGLAADGATPRPLQNGIELGAGADGTIVGGTGDTDGNLIAHNTAHGIRVQDAAAGPIQILGNSIGLDALGRPAGNVGDGIRITSSNGVVIGTITPGAGNEISANGAIGIGVLSGTDNRVSGNSIHDNLGVEVDLGNGTIADGANVNDNLDVDAGGNTRLNHPTITTATRSSTQITANIGFNTAANLSGLSIELFRSPNCDNIGGLGQTRHSVFTSAPHSANGSGDVSASIPFTDADQSPAFYSAMLSDANGNTSEISPCVAVPLGLLFLDGFE